MVAHEKRKETERFERLGQLRRLVENISQESLKKAGLSGSCSDYYRLVVLMTRDSWFRERGLYFSPGHEKHVCLDGTALCGLLACQRFFHLGVGDTIELLRFAQPFSETLARDTVIAVIDRLLERATAEAVA